jgi:hypothetical protein
MASSLVAAHPVIGPANSDAVAMMHNGRQWRS